MLKKILIAVAAFIAGLFVIAAFQPGEFRLERSITIAAAADQIFPMVDNLKKFNEWSPWAKLDPNAKTAFAGPEEGVGATFSWDGNRDVGQESMSNIDSSPNERVRFRMDFIKPMQATNTAEFTFKSEENLTAVTWALYGHRTYLCKFANMVLDTDKMVGAEFEKGLGNLKDLVETKK